MENAFNCSERLWISQVNFAGQPEIDFLQRWKTFFIPSRESLSRQEDDDVQNTEQVEMEEVVEEEPQPSTSKSTRATTKNTTTNSNNNNNKNNTNSNDKSIEDKINKIKKRIEKLGDNFFAVPETIKKRKRKELAKKKANRKTRANDGSDKDDEENEEDEEEEDNENDKNENPTLNIDGEVQEKEGEEQKKEEELYFWKGPNGLVEDQYGNQLNLNEVSSEDDIGDIDDDSSTSSSDCEEHYDFEQGKNRVDIEETARQWMKGLGPLDKLNEIIFGDNSNNTTQNDNNTQDNNEEIQTIFINVAEPTNDETNETTTVENNITEIVLFDPGNADDSTEMEINDDSIEMENLDYDADFSQAETEDETEPDDDLEMTTGQNTEDKSTEETPNPNENTENNNTDNMQVSIPREKTAAEQEEDYFENLQKKRWEIKQERERKDVKRRAQLQQLFGFDDKELDFMISQSQFTFDEIKRMPFVDEPILKNGLMPILAPPIPRSVLKLSQALAVYVNFSSNPGEFQWKCKSANEQMADSLNDDLRFKKRMEAEKKFYESTDHEEFVDEKEVVFTIVFYHTSSASGSHVKLKEPEMAVTVNILGSQTLMDLRKLFYCKHDHIGKEIEGNPLESGEPIISKDACLEAMQKNMDKPCGMFVGSTMYRNEASIENHDYAAELLKWSEGLGIFRKKLVGPFEAGVMETTKLIDLRFKHGFPYLFIHQGNCEHLMVIEKVRLVHPAEFLLKIDFPKIVKSNFRTIYCQVENTRIARFAIRNSKWFPQDPMLICPECLESCYKGDERVDNFKLYPFLQISSLF